jgi:alpha-beta hydrolase superfamily lysophospholipase
MERWFGEELIADWEKAVELDSVASNDRNINLEVYDTGNADAKTVVFSHGIAGYARILLPLTIPMFKRGYNLVVPDLQGYGYNDGLKGDFEWSAHVNNLVDAVEYAKTRFGGKLFLGGASMGGPLAYAAASKIIDRVDGLICWCLWDLSDREFMTRETNTGRLTYPLMPMFRLASKLLGRLRLKTYRLISYDTLTDSEEMNDLVKLDPQAGTHITIRGAASLILQSRPELRHEDFHLPTLVVQPGADRMTPKVYTERVYEKLGSRVKEYVELEGADHFPTERKYHEKWASAVDSFLKNV